MTTPTLTEFLLARITEDEAAARDAVIPAHDGYKPHPDLSHWVYEDGGEVEYELTSELLAHPYPDRIYVTCDGEGLTPAVDDRVGPHIARHDPARVLAECEAKRRIVGLSFDYAQTIDGEWGCCHTAEQIRAGECTVMNPNEDEMLQSLAAVYADHPDFDEAWRAEG